MVFRSKMNRIALGKKMRDESDGPLVPSRLVASPKANTEMLDSIELLTPALICRLLKVSQSTFFAS